MGEYIVGFLPRDALKEVVVEHLLPLYPDVFKPEEHLQVVGIDIPARGILDNRRQKVEPRNGQWELQRGSYLVQFGFSLPDALLQTLRPRMFWRSSLQRVGVIGGSIILLPEQHDDVPGYGQGFMEGEVFGQYHVENPHGVVIEEGAGLAQLCFSCGGASTVVSENLKARRLRRFVGPGHIGRTKTTIPEFVEVDLQQLPNGRVGWTLIRGTAYSAELDGVVMVPRNAVLSPAFHQTDLDRNPAFEFLDRSTCLAEPGYFGGFDITLSSFANGVVLGQDDGLLRFTLERVLPIIGVDMAHYHGQWQGERYGQERHAIEFGSLRYWGLGGTGLTLEDFATKIREAGVSV